MPAGGYGQPSESSSISVCNYFLFVLSPRGDDDDDDDVTNRMVRGDLSSSHTARRGAKTNAKLRAHANQTRPDEDARFSR